MEEKELECINCGTKASELYRKLSSGVITISHCENCNEVVDKYIEYDPVLIFLDALLLKKHAFRHILSNSKLKYPWKLTIIFFFFDTYGKLMQKKSENQQALVRPDGEVMIYSALEKNFYLLFLSTVVEQILKVLSILVCSYSFALLKRFPHQSYLLVKGLLLSNFGKLFILPTILWGDSYVGLCLGLTELFIIASNVQVLRVVCGYSLPAASFIITIGVSCSLIPVPSIYELFETHLLSWL